MDIQFEELSTLLESLDLNEVSLVSYRNRNYWVDCIAEPGHGKPVEWFSSTSLEGADIYCWADINPLHKRPMIFHELIEADLVLHQEVDQTRAHNAARVLDREYAKRLMTAQELVEYETQRRAMEKRFSGRKD